MLVHLDTYLCIANTWSPRVAIERKKIHTFTHCTGVAAIKKANHSLIYCLQSLSGVFLLCHPY